MNDNLLLAGSLLILISGFSTCIFLKKRGISSHAVRDILHIGVSIWALIWPFFNSQFYPRIIVTIMFLIVLIAPFFSKISLVSKFITSVCGEYENWRGIQFYVFSFAFITWIASNEIIFGSTAMLSLSLGDGIGGFVGREAGRLKYKLPWTKQKSVEGSVSVFIFAFIGGLIIHFLFSDKSEIPFGMFIISSLCAAVVEGISPSHIDNLTIPIVVYVILCLRVSYI